MKIAGFQKTSLIDYPKNISSVLFLSRCNFRCPYCHNRDLVLDTLPPLDEEEILHQLAARKKYIDGVVITGGEPTIYNDLPDLITRIREISLLVKLDTNGSNPSMLRNLLDQELLDYVSMDIKSDLEAYSEAAGVEVDTAVIEESIDILKSSDIAYEFRTTVVPPFYNATIAENIGKLINNARKYYLQQFVPKNTLDPKFEEIAPYPPHVLQQFAEILQPYVDTEVR